ncbi:hypothetical protein B1R94_13650 [Mycolicibacterium litorale]|nr:hypothetical protein B1R94_13650 [Mycolicibacterium litorale]
MIWRTIAALSALWWVLIIAPAAVAARLLADAGPSLAKGWVLGIWIGGYVAQFLVFLAISRRSSHPVLLGWFVAAIVPWAADWTAPVSPWWLVVWALVVVAYVTWLVPAVARMDRLRARGVAGIGVVLEVIRPMFNAVVNKDRARRVLRVRVQTPHPTPAYEARLIATFTLGEIPEPGDRIAVRVDRDRPSLLEMIEDEPVQRAVSLPDDLAPQVAERLRRLTTMRDRGDLTDAEFASARRRLFED